MIKPPALKRGDTVGIVAPASNIDREMLNRGCEALRALGYQPVYEESIFDRDIYFAGNVERRARELEAMFLRAEVKAVICARGGYGTNYLLNAIDLKAIASHPKIFMGYSDVSTLLTYFHDSLGLVTFHGPMVAKDFVAESGIDLCSWNAALNGAAPWRIQTGPDSGVRSLAQGEAEGVLYGGCLSMLVATLGTPYEIQTDDKILFVEDVAAKPFQIDRMLMHLKLAGKLAKVRGMMFGEMLDCVQSSSQDYSLEQVVMRVAGDMGVPIAFGLRSGHVTQRNITLPLGVKSALKVSGDSVSFQILEPAVEQ